MTAEFNLIKQHFTHATKHTDLGVGDDAALVHVSAGHQLVVSTDMSLVDVHFFQDAEPYNIGWKSLAVNVSDMAAMGANPKWITLSIALPTINNTWLLEFSRGLMACASAFNIDLIGGDTTRGPLNISIQIMGEVPIGKALRRDGAKDGDDIWVSGHLGNAALGLQLLQKKLPNVNEETRSVCLKAINTPQPRIALGLALSNIATSCIDISDGLMADLGHVLKASNVGGTIQLESIPCLPDIRAQLEEPDTQRLLLAGGEDYELCFTAPSQQRENIMDVAMELRLQLMRVGRINKTGGLAATLHNQKLNIKHLGYDHFSSQT